MSAWYVMNAIGLYQMTPGNNTFYVGRPIVDRAVLSIEDGFFTINVKNNSKENKYVKRFYSIIHLKNYSVYYDQIQANSELTKWAVNRIDRVL